MTLTLTDSGANILLTQQNGTSNPFQGLNLVDSDPNATVSAQFNVEPAVIPPSPTGHHPTYGGFDGPGVQVSAVGWGAMFYTNSMSQADLVQTLESTVLTVLGDIKQHLSVSAYITDSDGSSATLVDSIVQGTLHQNAINLTGTTPTTITNGSTTHPLSGLTVTDSNVGNGVVYTATLEATLSAAKEPGYGVTVEQPPITFKASSTAALTATLDNFSYTAPAAPGQPFTEYDLTIKDNVVGSGADASVYFSDNAAPPPPPVVHTDPTPPVITPPTTVSQPPVTGPTPTPPTVAPPTPPNFSMTDTTTGASSAQAGMAYIGPVSYLKMQFVSPTQDSVNINSHVPGAFIVTGAGNDAIDVSAGGGQNVISAGTGNNFLTGGAGADTFFIDDRTAGQAVWDTINNFHAGDQVTIWGMTPQNALQWADNQGAAGYQGLTFHTLEPGGSQFASATLPGYSQADLASGRLTEVFGSSGGDNYLLLQGH